jgi:hypothetical protein
MDFFLRVMGLICQQSGQNLIQKDGLKDHQLNTSIGTYIGLLV